MKLKKLGEKYVKSEGKLHWAIVIGGFVISLTSLALAYRWLEGVEKQGAVAVSLFAFAVAYNQLVTWLEFQDWEEGATAALVVGGDFYTILLISILIGHFTTMLLCFAAAGTPMVIGSWVRYAMRRKQERQEARDRALKGLQG